MDASKKVWRVARVVMLLAFVGCVQVWAAFPRLERAYWSYRLRNIRTAGDEAKVFDSMRCRVYGFEVFDSDGKPVQLRDALSLNKIRHVVIYLNSGSYLMDVPVRSGADVINLRNY